MRKIFLVLDDAIDWLEMIATCIMVLIIFLQVLCRYFFNNALAWPEEIARYLFCWGTYLAVSISMRGDNNLRITILLDALHEPWRKYLNLGCCAVSIGFFLLLIWLTADLTIQIKELDEMMISLPIPVWIAWAGLPICFLLITIQDIRNFYLIATNQIVHKSECQ